MMDRLAQSEPDCSKSPQPFWLRFEEVIRWCVSAKTGSDSIWRTQALRPRSLERDYFSAVHRVSLARTFPKGNSQLDEDWLNKHRNDGRLLVYFPELELSDGTAEIETAGFLDGYDCPPWETWIGFFRDSASARDLAAQYLVAWVPGELVDGVERGIAKSMSNSIQWLARSEVGLVRKWPEVVGR